MPEVNYITTACTHCGGGIEFDADYLGEMATCPHCEERTPLLAGCIKPDPEPLPPPVLPAPTTKTCPFCAAVLQKAAVRCSYCRGMVVVGGEEVPPVGPCKACGRDVAALSQFCVHCGQSWPCLYFTCPGCRRSDFDIQVEQGSSTFVLLPCSLAGVFAYAVGSLFEHAIDRAIPGRRFLHCRVCGGEFLPGAGLPEEFFKFLPLA
jgi:hypothetical protein